MNVTSYNQNSYLERWRDLNGALEDIRLRRGLSEALDVLVAQQLDAGFIEDDLKAVRRFRIRDRHAPNREFTVQFNPRRAARHGGAGRALPPPGVHAVNGGCFLCSQNVAWQQRGLEVGFDLRLGNTDYCCYANPFPLMPVHVTVATREHVPQGWAGASRSHSPSLETLVEHVLSLADQLPGFVVFFNGPDAGASIPAHFHFQAFRRPAAQDALPLEQWHHTARPGELTVPGYPLTVACFEGDAADVVAPAAAWIQSAERVIGASDAASANLIATRTGDRVRLFVAPRHRAFAFAPGFAGLVGGLEILGEIVLTTEREKELLDAGQFTYERIAGILAAVEPPGLAGQSVN